MVEENDRLPVYCIDLLSRYVTMRHSGEPACKLEIRRIAFIYLPTDFSDANRFYEAFQRRPPLGLQYLQATVHRSGVSSELLDGVLEPLPENVLARRLEEENFDLAAFYVSSMNRGRVCRAVRRLKADTPIPIIAGGPGSVHADELTEAGTDAVCMGEGEEVLLEILSCLGSGLSFSSIRGLTFRMNGEIVETSPRPLIQDLDRLPFPHRNPKTVREYYDFLNPMVRKPCITLTASRGCYYRCSFCYSHRFWRNRYRLRSVENVLEEIRWTHRNFSARYLLFVDDVFPQSREWVEPFLDAWRGEDFRIPWMCILNPNSYRNDRHDLFKRFRDAGCNMISFGAQSADPEILKRAHRRPDEARQLLEAVKTASRLDIVTAVTYIFGLPGETEETAGSTVQQLLHLKAHLMDAHVLEVLPGTEIAAQVAKGMGMTLSENRMEAIRRYAFRRFYLNPRTLFRLLGIIVRKNPGWFLLFPFQPVWAALKRKRNNPMQ